MPPYPARLIGTLWGLWVLYWFIAARSAKPTRERESVVSRAAFVLVIAVVVVLLADRWPGLLGLQLIGGGWTRYWCAVALLIAGLGFSIWARAILGRNWSGTVAVKVDHELIQRGPYRYIRHPIYTGILLALLGSGLGAGRVQGLLAFALGFLALWLKSRKEERWMAREFAERYAAYKRSSWALVPFVL
jgi:protein-S-isoprenylcysteine O-methyltransferase Ste14